MQKAATRILITEVLLSSSSLLILMAPEVLCCIEIADQGKWLPLLPGQAGENYLRIMHCHNTPKIIKIVQHLYLFLPRANGFALEAQAFSSCLSILSEHFFYFNCLSLRIVAHSFGRYHDNSKFQVGLTFCIFFYIFYNFINAYIP